MWRYVSSHPHGICVTSFHGHIFSTLIHIYIDNELGKDRHDHDDALIEVVQEVRWATKPSLVDKD